MNNQEFTKGGGGKEMWARQGMSKKHTAWDSETIRTVKEKQELGEQRQ